MYASLSNCPAATTGLATVPRAENKLQPPVSALLLLQLLLLAVCAHLCLRASVYLCADLSHTKCHIKSKHPHTGATAKS